MNSFVGCLGNSSATGLKNQMKESKASERKTTQQSLFFHLLFLCALLMITSCCGSRQYDFKSTEDALKQYQAFFQTIKGHSDSDAEQLAGFINQWHEYGDTVLNFIKKDPSFSAHSGLSMGEVDSKKIRVEFSLEDMDMSEFQDGATYPQIKEYVLEHTGLKVSNLYISQIKRKCGIGVGKNYNLPKSEDSRQPQCPPEKEKAIREAFKYFGMI